MVTGRPASPVGSMARVLLALVLLISAFAPAFAAQPPLIDRELIFGNPEIAGPELSPDGKYIAFLKPWNDTRNIYVKKVDEPFSAARLLTTEAKRPIPAFFWTRDGKQILYVKDNDGDENFNVYAVDPAAAPAPGAEAPASRDLTGLKGVRVEIFAVPREQPDLIYIGLNDRDKAWHDLYQLKISTGEKTLMYTNKDRVTGWKFDESGKLRLAVRTAENGDTEILRVDGDKLAKIYDCTVFEYCEPHRFTKDGTHFYLGTNKGSDVNFVGLVLADPQTGGTEPVDSDPLKRVDFGRAIFSENTGALIATVYHDEKVRIYFRDKAWQADYDWLKAKFPGMEISFTSATRDENKFLISVNSDVEPGKVFLFERAGRKLTPQFTFREKLPRDALSTMTPVSYPSSDGLVIPAYLTLPKGLPAKNLPTIILPHGGPWGRDDWGYNPLAQFWSNRGYAVLQPNFRASTGYGKKFLDAGNLQWGDKMQDDVTWGVKYLIAKGIADPKRIGITGGSYGGYATLAGVAFTPDLYAAAVDVVGPSNLITLLNSIPPYWEAGRAMFRKRLGDSSTEEGKAQMMRQSPLNSADKIRTALLVAQGANDPRVNHAEAEQIVIALRDRGFPVEYILAPDEGHGFRRPINSMALYMASEKFFANHLGGRCQDGGTTPVVNRLAEITVDPKTVTLTAKEKPSGTN